MEALLEEEPRQQTKPPIIQGDRIAGGRKKDVYACRGISNKVLIRRTDIVTSANGGQRQISIPGVGAVSMRTATNIFKLFNCRSIETHFCELSSDQYDLAAEEFIAVRLNMVPLRVRVHRTWTGKIHTQFFLKNGGGNEKLLTYSRVHKQWIRHETTAGIAVDRPMGSPIGDLRLDQLFIDQATSLGEEALSVLEEAFSKSKYNVIPFDLRFEVGWMGEMPSDQSRMVGHPTLCIGGVIDADSICLCQKGDPAWVMARKTISDYLRFAEITDGFANSLAGGH